MTPVILSSCDAWSSYESIRTIGVYTNRRIMNSHIITLLNNDSCVINQYYDTSYIKSWTIKELQNNIDYLHLEEIELNKML